MRADHFPTTKAFLHHLRIENGNLGEIKPELFTEELFGQLKTFELINLPIKHLYLNSFSRLELLIIRNLTLTNIQLNNMPNLNYFSIFNCSQAILNIANLMKRAEVPKLKILLFNYNNINRTITANTFSGLRNIETLDLRYNRIESFSGNAFINLPSNVKTINLARNRLKFLPEKFFSILDRLKNNEVIHLYKNSFECGCQVENLRFYLSNFPKKFFEHSLTKRVFCKISEQNSITYMDVQHNPIICLELNKHETEEEVEEITDDDPPKIMNKITIYCHPRDSFIQPINLTINKPQHAISIVKHSSESKYCLKVNEYPMGYFIVGFENEFSIDEDQNLISTCILDSLHMKRKICSKPPLRPNHLYRFCVMKKNSATVSPLECVFSYTKTKVVTIGWISIKYRTIVVAAWIFVGVITFIFGTYLSFFLAKKYPKLFCRKVKKPIIIYRKTTSHFGRLNQRYASLVLTTILRSDFLSIVILKFFYILEETNYLIEIIQTMKRKMKRVHMTIRSMMTLTILYGTILLHLYQNEIEMLKQECVVILTNVLVTWKF